MVIPYAQLQPETLRSLIEEFATRHGAVHGHVETAMPVMVTQIMAQLRAGRAIIVFDEQDGTCSIVPHGARGSCACGPG